MLKIALVFVKNVFFGLKKGISELSRWVGQKHTAEWKENFHIPQKSLEKSCTKLRPYIWKIKNQILRFDFVKKQVAAALYYLADEVRMRKVAILSVLGNGQFPKLSGMF